MFIIYHRFTPIAQPFTRREFAERYLFTYGILNEPYRRSYLLRKE